MYPILFYIGDKPVWSYYVFNIMGILAGFLVLYLNIKKFKKDKNIKILLFALLIFIPFVLGSRLGASIESVIAHKPFLENGFHLLGPVSLWWGLVLATLSAFPAAAWLGVNVWETADLFSLSISVGGIFARIACFTNGCCFGTPCPENVPAGFFTSISPAGKVFPDMPLYPVQAYESLSWLLIFLILILISKKKTFHGQLIIIMGALYSIARFILEFYRYHEIKYALSIAQIWCIFIFVTGAALYFIFIKYGINAVNKKHNKH